ncbi:MAG: SUMF1/EgtB/PvdO family nonheme iron enzyme, partial [Bacteroidales bacterium]|nr:SUMF1/EgtB/PvdO family nonheme iron enzyme [Bacteroidales bacterium]
AARGGNVAQSQTKHSGSNTIDDIAWYWDNSDRTIHPVGQKQPNALGIYDINGNVWERCYDWYGSYSSSETDPTGPSSGPGRVCRGGSWYDLAVFCRVSNRDFCNPFARDRSNGFRIVCSSK